MQQWDQKVAKDCQDCQEPKGSVDSLVGQAHLACQDLQVGSASFKLSCMLKGVVGYLASQSSHTPFNRRQNI